MKKTSVVIAFDFGLKRIGCAIGQNLTNTANPLGTISNSRSGIDWNRIEQWIEEWQPDKLIIGKTKKADGSKSDLDEAINIFAKKLRKKNIPVDYVDEARSSIEAREILKIKRRIGSNKKIKKETIDAISASIIAERWLNNNN